MCRSVLWTQYECKRRLSLRQIGLDIMSSSLLASRALYRIVLGFPAFFGVCLLHQVWSGRKQMP